MSFQITISTWLFVLPTVIGIAAVIDRILEIPRSTRTHVVADVLDHLQLRDLVTSSENSYRRELCNQAILAYHANSIAHRPEDSYLDLARD